MVSKVPWSPHLTKAIAHILYWKGIWKQQSGGHIGAQHLHHLAKKGGLTHQLDNLQQDTNIIESNICQAYKWYTKLKKDTSRCNTWLKQLVEAQAQEQKTTTKSIWKKIHTTEKI